MTAILSAQGLVVWLTARTGPINGVFLPTLRRLRIAPPPGRPDMIGVDLSRRRIYVDAMARSGVYNVWTAPAPTRSP